MSKHFAKIDIDVSYLFSGKEKDKYFDMECFGDFRCCSGLTFNIGAGRVNYIKTAFSNNVFRFLADILSLDIDDYDVILTDFEPITAWAGKLKGKTVISVGHQPAFRYDIPAVSSTHHRAPETVLELVCRLLLEQKKNKNDTSNHHSNYYRHNN